MKLLTHFRNRPLLGLAAILATGSMLLGPAPSRADGERLSLLVPGQAETPAPSSAEPSEHFAPASEVVEAASAATEAQPSAVKVQLERIDNHEMLNMDLPRDGSLAPDDVKVVAHFFRCRRTGKQRSINAGVLAMLAGVADHWPGHTIQVVSGFRAPPYGAPHSRHFKGQAIDLRIPGVRTTALRDYVWRQNHGVGVGYYKTENFVHMDWRPEAQDRAWTGVEGGLELLNPRWARRARRSLPLPSTTPASAPVPYALSHSATARTL
jgi:uncharacterized protein YcbK (DUF882 family)